MISFQNFLGLNESALKLRAERASVISSNLANADTPNYKARDIEFRQALAARTRDQGIRMTATRSGHIGLAKQARADTEYKYRVPSQPSIDGNTVEENLEHAEFTKNSLEFQVAFTLLNSKFKGLRKAIKGE